MKTVQRRAEHRRQTLLAAGLMSCIRNSEPPAGFDRVDAAELDTAAALHGVSHVLLDWVQHAAPEHPVLPLLTARNRGAAVFDMKVRTALRNVVTSLPGDLPMVIFKGPVLAHLSRTACVRPYGDLDLLVTPDRFEEAFEALLNGGAVLFPEGGGWQWAFEAQHAQVPMRLSLAVPLDLHAHLCSRPHMRNAFRVDRASELLERRQFMDLGLGPVPVLGLEDMVLHSAAHAGWSGGERLGWLVDVDSVVRSGDVDWDVIVRRSREWRVAPLVNDVLLRCAALVGTPLPAEVVRRARRDPGTALLRTANLVDPPRASYRERGIARLLRLDTRESLPKTFAAFGSRLGAAVKLRIAGPAHDTPPSVIRIPEKDDRYRGDYLAFIRGLET